MNRFITDDELQPRSGGGRKRVANAKEREMSEWQPIETAPKDEIAILILNARADQCRVAYYDLEADPTYPWHVEDAAEGFNHHKDWPTHWMPRPERPQPEPTHD